MRYFIVPLFALFSLCHIVAQQQVMDSLRGAFQAEKDPFKKIDIFYEIANVVAFDNPAMEFTYADSLESMSKKAGYKKGLGMALHHRGFGYDDKGEYEKALEIFREELAVFVEIKDLKEQSTAYTNIAGIWSSLGNSDSSMTYYLKSLDIDEKSGNKMGASVNHNNIGQIYSDEGAYDKAVEHFQKALKLRQELGVERKYMAVYSNLATVYSRMGFNDKSEEAGLKAMEYAIKYDNKAYAGIVANNMASNYNDQKKFEPAITWLKKAESNWLEIGNERYLTYAYYNYSKAYAGLGDGNKAIQFAKKGFEIVQRLKLDSQNELYYKAFAEAYETMGNKALAYDYFKKYVAIADSIFKQDNTKIVAKMEAQFESQKKEAQLTRQQLELERQSNQKKTILIGAIALLLAFGAGFNYLRNKQRIRQKETELAAQIEHAEAEKLREMDTMKSTFFANISHEFRTPLTLIVSPLEQMINGGFQGDFQKYYRIMHRNGKRLLDLVNQLLDLSRLESGKLKLQVAEGDLSGYIKAVAYSFESLAVRKQIDYQVIVEDSTATYYFDKDKVEKILNNLISNAFKFTNDGKQIVVSSSIAEGMAQFKVMDQGMGIPADQLPHIFERFAKTVTSELQPGSGIGLALTKELVELHKGKIEVESREGEGTIFTVMLPITQAAYATDETTETTSVLEPLPIRSIETAAKAPQEVNIKTALENLDKPVLLIVEDNFDVRNYIVDQFRGQYQIIEAENGRLGLERAMETTPDLVISDIMMPEMDGTEFCKLLKTSEKTSHIPVVMLTALAEQGDRLKGLELGADDYLVKPFDAKELTVRVANLIAGRQKLQEHYRRSLNSFAPIAEVKAESVDAVFLKKVREAVEANLEDENFSVVELSGQVGMSRSQLHRKLSALTGFSPNEVIRNMRLERAKQLLEKKAGNASEVAYLTGFNSPAYFAKCFKDYFGLTPSEI